MQQVKGNAMDFFSWMKDNQDDIVKGYQLIYGIIKNKGELPAMVAPAEPLPNIND
jgi:hypothetical protein